MAISKLFTPIRVGKVSPKHRVVLAPLTRLRVSSEHVPHPFVAEYYAQRAATPGTLLITEATFISAPAGAQRNIPGIWNEEQIAVWKTVSICVLARPNVGTDRSWF